MKRAKGVAGRRGCHFKWGLETGQADEEALGAMDTPGRESWVRPVGGPGVERRGGQIARQGTGAEATEVTGVALRAPVSELAFTEWPRSHKRGVRTGGQARRADPGAVTRQRRSRW